MNKPRILVIDDEVQIRKLLQIILTGNGFDVMLAENGETGIILAASHPPELVLLDLGLPGKSGHSVLEELRSWYSKAVIILSVRNSETDIVTALDNGATDYLAKPFRTAELLARIRSAIRRNTPETESAVAQFGNLTIDFAARTVSKNNIPVKLTNTEYNLLALLAANEGRVLTHQHLLKEIWGLPYRAETQYLRVFIGTLRKKIENNPQNPQHIITESRVGYRFI